MENPTIRHITEISSASLQGVYRLDRFYRVGPMTLRVVVSRTADPSSSTATLSLFTPENAWRFVADSPGTSWHDRTPLWGQRADSPGWTNGFDTLRQIADALLSRSLTTIPELTKLQELE
ncbi:hypothetical protein [Kutzneria sp. 744]|uniref:hypothetical protein n=1 Tax=Kutzneria sp. (strain 744) TaxID=345341 RepID=UPI0003EEBE7B|nr:hypothetical protein [Kutzneria sp. 744]EWM19695.1 hypothetical protein KUTG_09999 [Kutzneria sp. 744]